MLAKKDKFPMRVEFLHFRARAQRVTTPHLVVFHLPSATSSHLSIVVPSKVNKAATTRNWLKRLMYDAIWPEMKDKSTNHVIIFKPLPLTKSITTKDMLINELKSLNV